MDELLHSRVEQLKQIDEELERIASRIPHQHPDATSAQVKKLRLDLATMVQEAEREYRDF